MELKLVKSPIQNERTIAANIPVDSNYPDDMWFVETKIYRQADGGLLRWLRWLEEKQFKTVYLYEITTKSQKIVNGSDEKYWQYDLLYYVRADYRK